MDLDTFRKQNPTYADKSTWPDDKLATGLYNKYYKDKMSLSDFTKQIGVTTVSDQEDSQMSDEQWQAYATTTEAKIKREDSAGLEEPMVNPIDAIAGPLGAPARVLVGKIIGKGVSATAAKAGLQGTAEKVAQWLTNKSATSANMAATTGAKSLATNVGASIAAEPLIGTGLEYAEDALSESEIPTAVKIPALVVASMVTGTLTETAIQKLGASVGNQLVKAGKHATPENVYKVLKSYKVAGADTSGAEDVITKNVKRRTKPASMAEAVKAITKAKKDKGVQDIPDVFEAGDSAVKSAAKSQGSETLAGMAPAATMSVSQDEDGNISIDPKMLVAGAALGVAGAKAVNKMMLSTRLPGLAKSHPLKKDIRNRRNASKKLKKLGFTPDEIFEQTKMAQGEDGRWYFEIDDSGIKVDVSKVKDGSSVPLDHVLTGETQLFDYEPQLRKVPVTKETNPSYLGSFRKGTHIVDDPGSIRVTPGPHAETTMLHETQHGVQFVEGTAGGSNPQYIMRLDSDLKLKEEWLARDGGAAVNRKEIKKIRRERKRLGLYDESEAYSKAIDVEKDLKDKVKTAQAELLSHEIGSAKHKAADSKLSGLKKEFNKAKLEANHAYKKLEDKSSEVYENVLGERMANSTADRYKLSMEMRDASRVQFKNSTIIENFTAQASEPATTAAVGATAGAVDWDEYERTGIIQITNDPTTILRGALAGAGVGMGLKGLPKIASSWTNFTQAKMIEPLKDVINNKITNETVRYQMGLNRSEEVADLLRNYKVKADLVLRKAVALGRELNDIAPTRLGQKRLGQILEGGITTNPDLAKKAHKVNAMFKALKEATRDLNLSQYSKFDNLTKRQRQELRDIIYNTETPSAERIVAQDMLKNHYKVGSAMEYLPIFDSRIEGLTKAEKRVLKEEISALKKQSRTNNPEGNQTLEATIAELEIYLKKGTREKSRVKGVTLDRGYSSMRQDLPAESSAVLNRVVNAGYRAAKGAATQGTDVLKMSVLTEVSRNPEWVWPKRVPGEPRVAAPANYIKIPEGKEWGPLSGRKVRNDVMADLEEVLDLRSNAERNMDKIMGMWKYGKAILNPVTHVRNFASNVTLSYFAGLDPTNVGVYSSAAKAIKQGRANPYFKEAEDWGLFNGTFVDSDISVIRDELVELREHSSLANWVRKAVSIPATAYDQSERFFKTAVFINERQAGKTIDEAAKHAEKYLFNYQDLPPGVKHYKRWVAPFITYTYKATPVLAEQAITKPWKFAAIAGAAYGIEETARRSLGLTKEEVKSDKAQIPDGDTVFNILLPFTDMDNNKMYFNVEPFLPWSSVGATWGQSNVPLGDWLPSNPLFTIGAAVAANKNLFSGREIYDTVLDSNAEIIGKQLEYAWKQVVPSLAPGGYAADKLIAGFKNDVLGKEVTDYAGRKKNMPEAVLSALLGIKVTHADEKALKRYTRSKLRKIQFAVNRRRSTIKLAIRRNEMSHEEGLAELKVLQDLQVEKHLRELEGVQK